MGTSTLLHGATPARQVLPPLIQRLGGLEGFDADEVLRYL